MILNLEEYSSGHIYHTMMQTIIPRPVAWVMTDNGDDTFNLAPFSTLVAVTSDPPILMISVGKKSSGEKKDTWKNIEERKEFLIHIPHMDFARHVTASSEEMDHGRSELDVIGLKTVEWEGSSIPRIDGIRAVYACELYDIVLVGNRPQAMILGKARSIYLDDEVAKIENHRLVVDANKMDPLGRLGGSDYTSLGETITIPRPK